MNEKETIMSLLKDIPNPVIFDIGACDGHETLWFKHIFPGASIHTFEPDPRNIAKIKAQNIHTTPGINFNEFAIGETAGTFTLYQSDGRLDSQPASHTHTASSSIKKPTEDMYNLFPWIKFDKSTECAVMPLDTYVSTKGVQKIDLIWADVQGAERELILGGAEALKNTKYFYTEYCNTEIYENEANLEQITKMLPDYWEVVKVFECDVLFKNNSI